MGIARLWFVGGVCPGDMFEYSKSDARFATCCKSTLKAVMYSLILSCKAKLYSLILS
jgi:hypothetical protein